MICNNWDRRPSILISSLSSFAWFLNPRIAPIVAGPAETAATTIGTQRGVSTIAALVRNRVGEIQNIRSSFDKRRKGSVGQHGATR